MHLFLVWALPSPFIIAAVFPSKQQILTVCPRAVLFELHAHTVKILFYSDLEAVSVWLHNLGIIACHSLVHKLCEPVGCGVHIYQGIPRIIQSGVMYIINRIRRKRSAVCKIFGDRHVKTAFDGTLLSMWAEVS